MLCPIVAVQGVDHLLYVLRPQRSNVHAGQIAFPGGKAEGAESPLDTALRECEEEVGAPIAQVTALGELPPRISTSRFSVHCLVGRVQPFEVRPDPREVDRVLFVPLADLRDPTRWRDLPPPAHVRTTSATAGRQPRTSPHFEHGADLIWGLTARFTKDLLHHLAP